MKRKQMIFWAILALMTGPTWGSVADFDLDAEVVVLKGQGTQDAGRRYINIEVIAGRDSLLAAIRHDAFDSLPRKSFHGRNFFVIDQQLPDGLADYLDRGRIFNKSTSKTFPDNGSFWAVYWIEGFFNEETDAFIQEEGGTLYTVGAGDNGEDGVLTEMDDLPPFAAGLYFALKYREIVEEASDPVETPEIPRS